MKRRRPVRFTFRLVLLTFALCWNVRRVESRLNGRTTPGGRFVLNDASWLISINGPATNIAFRVDKSIRLKSPNSHLVRTTSRTRTPNRKSCDCTAKNSLLFWRLASSPPVARDSLPAEEAGRLITINEQHFQTIKAKWWSWISMPPGASPAASKLHIWCDCKTNLAQRVFR